ncbi:MAG: amidohydrolase family protein [Clostridiales bacterium]|nr:amidohydrolase family protein [Clostridiales bacterium]
MPQTLRNCRLIPELSGGACGLHDVVIDNGKIESILVAGGKAAEDDIDCGGKTLLPGLFDLHNHLSYFVDFTDSIRNDFELLMYGGLSVKKFLDYGVTTVRDMGSARRLAIAIRNAVNKGLFVGPRIIAAGRLIGPPEAADLKDGIDLAGSKGVSGVDEMTRAAREEFAEGADVLKIYASGSGLSPTGQPTKPILFPEEVRAAVRVANLVGKRVAAHCHSTEAIRMCIDEGVYTIEHATFIDNESIEKIKDGRTYLVPTFTPMHHRKGAFKDPVEDERLEKRLADFAKKSSVHIRAAYEAGLVMGFGTDVAVETFGVRTGMEFKMRKELCDMANVDMLLQATKHSALIAGLENVTGQVKEGLAADLLLVDGNPDANIEVMYQKPEMVVLGGKIVKRDGILCV